MFFLRLLRRVMAALDPVKVIVQNLTAADVRSYNAIDCCMCIICICIRVSATSIMCKYACTPFVVL